MERDLDRVKLLVGQLDQAARSYYSEGIEIMTNYEYDQLYDELVELEQRTGVVLANSPTMRIGYEVLSELPKETHSTTMLSLDKTKEVDALQSFIGTHQGILSWKLDGLTIVLTYSNGELVKAVTRGNGEIGEVVTNNAKTFKNIPLHIQYKGDLVIRGEAVIRYSDFNQINERMENVESNYKNPRNLCAGSVRQLNNEITASRNIRFYAFALVQAEGVEFENSIAKQFKWLKQLGFEVVEHYIVDEESIVEQVDCFAKKIGDYDVPSDGLVLFYDDLEYGNSLGQTAKFPRNGIAFKWADEIAETQLLEIEWSPSRTGLINPVAIFEPVELEGTTVSRASVHNLSIMEELGLGIGDTIKVYKANMIIPQIAECVTASGNVVIPEKCPACGESTQIMNENGTNTLNCVNVHCSAKHIKLFTHFASRNAFNIDGLSEETLKKFVTKGFLKELADIFKIAKHEEEIVTMEGFGRKSYDNLIKAIDNAREIMLSKFIYSLGIPNIGLSNAKMICKSLNGSLENVMLATEDILVEIDGVGKVIAKAIVEYFRDNTNINSIENLLNEVTVINEETSGDEQLLAGNTFVITGNVNHFANRNEVKELIEKLGGKVTGGVTSKTNYLINNDVASSSSKNKKAKQLGIDIITEEQFLEIIGR